MGPSTSETEEVMGVMVEKNKDISKFLLVREEKEQALRLCMCTRYKELLCLPV